MLIVSEVALAVMLLVGAGLFVSSFVRLMRIDIGISYDKVLTLPVYPRVDFNAPKEQRDRDLARAAAIVSDVIAKAKAIPGVTSASAISGGLPLSGNWSRSISRCGRLNGSGFGQSAGPSRIKVLHYQRLAHFQAQTRILPQSPLDQYLRGAL